MKVLAIIPAKGKSRGIAKKNTQKLRTKPLIQYTIQSAIKIRTIDRVIVSTDNEEVVKLSKKLGAEIPFIRPKKLSHSTTTNLEVIKHTLNFLSRKENYSPDIIVLLQLTSPFRSISMIENSIKILKRTKATSVISVCEVKNHPYTSFWYKKDFLKPFRKDYHKFRQRQNRPILFAPTGSIYTFWHDTLKKYGNTYGPRIKPLITKKQEHNIDIDTPFDLFVSEMVLRYWDTYKKKFQ